MMAKMMPSSSLPMSIMFCVMMLMVTLQYSNGQFPVECMGEESLQNRICCPSECSNHGTCTDLNLDLASLPSQFNNYTVRNHWPYYFTHVCICDGNYAGFDCSRCKYGYYGNDCSENMPFARRPISSLSDSEWTNYINILKAARNFPSGYFVFLEEPTGPDTDLSTLSKTAVNLYDLFIWQHHYAAKDNEMNIDYAHESTGFPTWHRQYLLWLEWELQYMLKETQPARYGNTYYKFRLHYWDWQMENQRDENSPFKRNRLGVTVNVSGFPRVQGDLVGNGWDTRCWSTELAPGSICDPNVDTGPLQRCPFTDPGMNPCDINNPDWPKKDVVQEAVRESNYDGDNYDKCSKSGFRNFLEGFNVLSNDQAGIESCSTDRQCTYGMQCDGMQSSVPIARRLHNIIHIILGIGHFEHNLKENEKGVMADVAAAASDPIFINHHAMVDYIFEMWLKKNNNPQYPQDLRIHRGHRENDHIVPFFPVVKQGEMFKTADNFGYSYEFEHGNNATNFEPASWLLTLVIIGVALVF